MANALVARAKSSELAFYLQEKGLCEDFKAWYEEKAPVQRLLDRSNAARQVNELLEEGVKRGYDAAFLPSLLDKWSDSAASSKKAP